MTGVQGVTVAPFYYCYPNRHVQGKCSLAASGLAEIKKNWIRAYINKHYAEVVGEAIDADQIIIDEKEKLVLLKYFDMFDQRMKNVSYPIQEILKAFKYDEEEWQRQQGIKALEQEGLKSVSGGG